jgi:sugar lactone lactonase YvrE
MTILPHDPPPLASVPTRTITTWPIGTWLENLVALPDGRFVVTIHNSQELQIVAPDGSKTVLAKLPKPPAGVVEIEGVLYVACGVPGQAGGELWRVGLDGSAELWVAFPEALFPNGATPFHSGHLLVADSIRGELLDVDLTARTARVWLAEEALRKVTAEPMMPGINGVKVFGGHVYFTNTDRALFLRAAIQADGSPGPVETLAERFRGDDFAFDSAGNAYLTTHLHASIVRWSPRGASATLADRAAGLAGSTAAAFGRTEADRTALFVTTTGGLLQLTPDDPIGEPRLVRLEIGIAGHPLTAA